MRVVPLSDHPAAMLRAAQRRRVAAERGDGLAYQDVLAVHGERVARARAARDQAWAQHRWVAWLRGVFAVRRLRHQTPPAPARASGPTDEEAKLAAGMEGERLVENGLSLVLDDEWALLRGYHNRSGEIDHLLIGPRGVFAIEGKHRSRDQPLSSGTWRRQVPAGAPQHPYRPKSRRRVHQPRIPRPRHITHTASSRAAWEIANPPT